MPIPKAETVARARAALEARGGIRIPTGWLQPEAAQALKALVAAGYAETRVGAIAQALLDAQRKVMRRK